MSVVRVKAYISDAKVHMFGFTTDTKPITGVNIGERFWETDTGDIYSWSGSAWLLEVGARGEDFMLDVARGRVPGMATLVIRGHNPSQSSASGFVDVAEGGNLVYLSTAEIMDIVSTSENDTADGTGARTVLIDGIDQAFEVKTEVVTLNGITDVPTVNTYCRINTMVVLTAGSSGWNEGNITCTADVGGSIQSELDATESISQNSHYTVPLGKTLHVMKLEFNAAKLTAGTAPIVEFKGYARPGGSSRAWIQFFDKRLDTARQNELDVPLPFPTSSTQLSAKSDFRFRTDTDQNSTEVRTRMYGILIAD